MSFENLLIKIKMNCEEIINRFKKEKIQLPRAKISLFETNDTEEFAGLTKKRKRKKLLQAEKSVEQLITACWFLSNDLAILKNEDDIIKFCKDHCESGEDPASPLNQLFNDCVSSVISLCEASDFFPAKENPELEKVKIKLEKLCPDASAKKRVKKEESTAHDATATETDWVRFFCSVNNLESQPNTETPAHSHADIPTPRQ